jgi:hypothetical protein
MARALHVYDSDGRCGGGDRTGVAGAAACSVRTLQPFGCGRRPRCELGELSRCLPSGVSGGRTDDELQPQANRVKSEE